MANFLRPTGGQNISSQTIEVECNGHVDIGLYGYLDSSGTELEVSASATDVAGIERRNAQGDVRLYRITAGKEAGETAIEARTTTGAVWDTIRVPVQAHGTHVAEQRRSLAAEARRHLHAHYVWGAAGATPDGFDGMPARPDAVRRVADRLESANPCLRAASCDVDCYQVCSGRFENVHGRVLSPGDPRLADYLAGLRHRHPDQWEPMDGLWPRKMEAHGLESKIVLGESRLGVRHFDCVGLVNYCMSIVLGRSVQDSVQRWINNSTHVTDGSDEPGDLLTRGNHHIGIATSDGWAIHARQASSGVVIDPVGSAWDRRGRFLR
jgi:cell wall-associated NlpC family hydrolase